MPALVTHLHRSDAHTFAKHPEASLELVAGIGVVGDAHAGATVRHRSRVARDPTQPNLRQVHLIPHEILDAVAADGFTVLPGQLGENVTTAGIDLHALPTGTVLRLGDDALIALTGLRNPCGQIDGVASGLRRALLPTGDDGEPCLRGGVMAVVVRGGKVRCGDGIEVARPPGPHRPLERV